MERILSSQVANEAGESVKIAGWVHSRRDHGKLIFLDLRDKDGLVQVVIIPSEKDANEIGQKLRPEWVVEIEGEVNSRPDNMINANIPSGTVEVLAKKITILNESKTPPFEIDKDTMLVNEEMRLKYRYLDLRSERLHKNIILRDKIIVFMRKYFHEQGFIEIETPIMMKGTPEGSREYIVPSRLHEGKFYVLPQSPQQFKQLLMVAGFERYFQIARCMRDEDQRGDRQPEFTQLDFEMSFVKRQDILDLTEDMFIKLIQEVAPEKKISETPFPTLTWHESMEKYGTDKPDLRKDKNDPNELAFCWIIDFPMFEKGEGGSIQAVHHPFCSIHPEDMGKLDSDPLSVRADAYDLVLNGYELSSGSIRIYQKELQKKVFDILKISEEEQQNKFGHMLEAFEYGAPPHGGFAPGVDRFVMLLAGEPNIREVIPFPKTGDGRDPMMGAPSEVDEKTLKEVHIKLDVGMERKQQQDETVFNKIKELLDSKNIKYEVMVHEPVLTSKQAAKIRGTELKQGARAIVFKTDNGFIQVVSPADKKIDESKIKKVVGSSVLSMANEKELKETTGCEIGAVPPFGNLFSIPVYVDKGLSENELIAFNAGMNTKSIKMSYNDWVKASNPVEGDFSLT